MISNVVPELDSSAWAKSVMSGHGPVWLHPAECVAGAHAGHPAANFQGTCSIGVLSRLGRRVLLLGHAEPLITSECTHCKLCHLPRYGASMHLLQADAPTQYKVEYMSGHEECIREAS